MKRCLNAFMALSALALIASGAAADDDPTAILLSCSGKVTVVREGGESLPGSFGMALYPGDEVKTAADSQAEIHFENGMWLQVGPESGMKIKGGSTKSQPSGVKVGDESFRVVQNMMKLKDPKGASSLAALRSAPGQPEIVLLSPCQTKILSPAPEFSWEAEGLDEELRLTVYDEAGIHHKADLKGGSNYGYPDDAPALESGVSYSWTIETTDPLRVPPLRSSAAFFEILSAGKAKVLEESLAEIDAEGLPSAGTRHFLRASAYYGHGLLEMAIIEMELAMADSGGTKEMHSILARLYAEAGRTGEALTEYDRIFE